MRQIEFRHRIDHAVGDNPILCLLRDRLLIEIITPGELCGGDCYSDEGNLRFAQKRSLSPESKKMPSCGEIKK